MKMLRHYLISDSLDDLELFEEQLEAAGVSTPQIHCLSPDDADLDRHSHLHRVQSFMKSDVVHSTTRGILVGVVAVVIMLTVVYFADWHRTPAGWIPFGFLAVLLLGFCTWEGGLVGIQKPNHNFARFAQALKDGKHLFIVDLEPQQEATFADVLKSHPGVELGGTERAPVPHWLLTLQKKLGIVQHTGAPRAPGSQRAAS